MELVLGIDIGTTSCCSSYMKGNSPDIIKTPTGKTLTPSVVSFENGNKIVIGEVAVNHMSKNEGNTVYATKRLIGKFFDDREVQEDIMNFTYAVQKGLDDKPLIQVEVDKIERTYTPIDICKLILQQMKTDAENQLGAKVTKAVVSVPAYFKDKQRKDTQIAAEKAGFEVLRIVNEPTAAAIAYSFNRITDTTDIQKNKTILVYDLGGGTFDVSIIRIEGNKINVLATGGDSHLGGEDFTNSIVEEIKTLYENDTGERLKSRIDLIRLKRECEEAKIILSQAKEVDITIKDETYTITRQRFTEINQFFFNKTIDIVNQTLNDCEINKSDIEDIILIGGSSKMPQIPQYIKKAFKNVNICEDIDPNEAVSKGAAIIANEILYNNLKIVRDETGEYSIINNELKLDESNYSVVIDYHDHSGRENLSVVQEKDGRINLTDNPNLTDKVIIPSLKYRPNISDVVSHSMGYEIITNSGEAKMYCFITRNEKIPITIDLLFKNAYDNQTSIVVKIFEGENEYTAENSKLDEFEISNIPPRPKGQYKFHLYTTINENGILEIEVKNIAGEILVIHRVDVANRSFYK